MSEGKLGVRTGITAGLLAWLPLLRRARGHMIVLFLEVLLFITLKHRQNVILDYLGSQFWGDVINSDLLDRLRGLNAELFASGAKSCLPLCLCLKVTELRRRVHIRQVWEVVI